MPIITMGIALVAFLAARTDLVPPDITMISTLRRTNSARSSGARSNSLPQIGIRWQCSVLLYSQARAEPAEMPRNGWIRYWVGIDRYPIRGTFPGCCASAMTAIASGTAKKGLIRHPVLHYIHHWVMYHAGEVKESVITRQNATGIRRVENEIFSWD